MSWKIGMPNLGHTMEEGKVAEWLKSIGDKVAKGDVVAVVETDKATFDVESPADGTLLAIDVPPGTVVTVGATIGTVGEPGEATSPPDAPAPQPLSPVPAETAPPPRRDRARASPAARILAGELGVALAKVVGTGEDGMITRDDVRAAAASTGPSGATPLSPMRRAIAEATERAWRTIPHVTLMRRADVTDVVGAKRFGLTAAVTRAAALALAQHRRFNGWLLDNSFREAGQVDIAIAVSAAGGLMMPVVRQADTKSVAALGDEIERLAAAARSNQLDGAQATNASFSISTLGRWKIEAFTPIISAPQVAILGVGALDRVAREAPDGAVRFRNELALSLVFDHRANDGVEAAEFLAAIADNLSHSERLEVPA